MAATPTSGPAIATRLQAGDREAFAALVERFHDFVHAVALANTRDTHAADDVTQETFLRALQSIHRLRDPARVDRWLAVIARNTARSIRRREQRTVPLDTATADRIPAKETDAGRAEIQALVRETLHNLNDKQREVLFLHYFAGQSTEQIATMLNISRHAAKKRLERARTALGQQIAIELDEFREPDERRSNRIKTVLALASAGTLPEARSAGFVAAAQLALSTLGHLLTKPAIVGGLLAAGIAGFAAWPKVGDTTPDEPAGQRPPTQRVAANSTDQETDVAPEPEPSMDEFAAEDPANAEIRSEPPPNPIRELPGRTPELAQPLSDPVSIQFDDEHVGTILEFISKYVDIDFVVDWRAIAPELKQQKNVTIDSGIAEYDVPPRIVPANGYVTDGLVPAFHVADLPASELLFQVLQPLGLSYVTQPGYVWITTLAKLEHIPEIAEDRLERTYKTADQLAATVSLDFEGGHLADLLEGIKRETRVGAVVDWQTVQPPDRLMRLLPEQAATLYEDIDQYDVEGVVPFISLDDVSLEESLKAMLVPIGMDFVPMHDFIWASSAKRIAEEKPVLTVPANLTPGAAAALNHKQLSIQFTDASLETIVGIVEESGLVDMTIEFAPAIDAKALVVPFLKLRDAPLRAVLFALLRPFDLDYRVDGDTITVVNRTTP